MGKFCKGIDRNGIRSILIENNVYIKERSFNSIFHIDKDGHISNDQVLDFALRKEFALFKKIKLCVTSLEFWGTFNWFIGGVAHIIGAYNTSPSIIDYASKIGAIFDFLGGLYLTLHVIDEKALYQWYIRLCNKALVQLVNINNHTMPQVRQNRRSAMTRWSLSQYGFGKAR